MSDDQDLTPEERAAAEELVRQIMQHFDEQEQQERAAVKQLVPARDMAMLIGRLFLFVGLVGFLIDAFFPQLGSLPAIIGTLFMISAAIIILGARNLPLLSAADWEPKKVAAIMRLDQVREMFVIWQEGLGMSIQAWREGQELNEQLLPARMQKSSPMKRSINQLMGAEAYQEMIVEGIAKRSMITPFGKLTGRAVHDDGETTRLRLVLEPLGEDA